MTQRPDADWVELAQIAEFKVNSHHCEWDLQLPFALVFGREPSTIFERLLHLATGQMVPLDNSDPFGKGQARAEVIRFRKRIASFQAIWDAHYLDSRVEVAEGLPPSKRQVLVVSQLVWVRTRKTVNKSDGTVSDLGSTDASTVEVDVAGNGLRIALAGVKRFRDSETGRI